MSQPASEDGVLILKPSHPLLVKLAVFCGCRSGVKSNGCSPRVISPERADFSSLPTSTPLVYSLQMDYVAIISPLVSMLWRGEARGNPACNFRQIPLPQVGRYIFATIVQGTQLGRSSGSDLHEHNNKQTAQWRVKSLPC